MSASYRGRAGDGESVDDLLMAADLALYAVKASGRGTYRFYDKSMNEELSDRRHIEMDCARPSRATSCRCTTSRSSTCSAMSSPALKRSRGGAIRCEA